MEIYLATSKGLGGPEEIAEEDIRPALPSNAFETAMVTALRSLAATSGLSITEGPSKASFQSRPAYEAHYSGGSNTFRGVSFMAGGSRLYILFAPTTDFSSFEASFKQTD